MNAHDDDFAEPNAIEYPIDGVLDLHMFAPDEVKDLIPDYLDECRKRGIREIRIIHGKGKGVLRRLTRAILSRHPEVESFGEPHDRSSWGATSVLLKKASPPEGENDLDD